MTVTKEEKTKGAVFKTAIILIVISAILLTGGLGKQCFSVAIACNSNGFYANVVNGTPQDYQLANQTFTTFTLGKIIIEGIPAILGILIAIFNKPITGMVLSWDKKQVKVRIKRVR